MVICKKHIFFVILRKYNLGQDSSNRHLQCQRRKAKLKSGAVRLGVQVSSRGGLVSLRESSTPKTRQLQAKRPSLNLAAEPKATKGLMLEVPARSLVHFWVAPQHSRIFIHFRVAPHLLPRLMQLSHCWENIIRLIATILGILSCRLSSENQSRLNSRIDSR